MAHIYNKAPLYPTTTLRNGGNHVTDIPSCKHEEHAPGKVLKACAKQLRILTTTIKMSLETKLIQNVLSDLSMRLLVCISGWFCLSVCLSVCLCLVWFSACLILCRFASKSVFMLRLSLLIMCVSTFLSGLICLSVYNSRNVWLCLREPVWPSGKALGW